MCVCVCVCVCVTLGYNSMNNFTVDVCTKIHLDYHIS